ncbi:MAG: RagB/SusD family nutrient uptake outer membrane protein, partial [Gracilimonas sp.]|nr:RagB/SusD family nutrient uptake outer membrane protein [Gracilimonas sp.]
GYPIDAELYEIRRERTLELAEEGFRRDDLRRWRAHNLFQNQRPKGYPFAPEEWEDGEVLIPTDENGFMDPYRNDIPNGYGFQENRDYLNPIPVDELTLNENLEQNPGW